MCSRKSGDTEDRARRTLMPAQRLSSWPYNARVRRPRESKISIAGIDEN
jgi:hypothetical protein